MTKEIKKPFDITYVKALEAAINCGFTINTESIDDAIISFKVKRSFWSWGENFHIKFTKLEQYLTAVEVESENFQISTLGKHEKNISDFFSELNNLLHK